MLSLITALFEIIGGAFAVWKRFCQKPKVDPDIIKRVKNATDIRNNSTADEQLLLPPNQRGA